MKTTKISKKSIEKEITKELKLRLASLGWVLLKADTNYFFKRHTEDIGWGFTFSLYNKGPYSCFFKVYITYIKITDIIKDLLIDTTEAGFIQDVGLVSSSVPKNTPILSISTLEEVPDFVDEMIDMINKSEQEYWCHYSNIENTIEEFKQGNHVFWPVSNLSQFVAHMVGFGIDNNRAAILNTAKEKAKELLDTGNYERDRDFVDLVIKAVESK